jgi:hypothetical protein
MTDTLVTNARILTMDPAAPLADWVLLRAGKVAALGRGAPPDAARIIDARGHMVLPGLQDAHVHLLSGGLDLATAAHLYEVADEAALIAALRAHAARHPAMPIVLGSGWQAGVFDDRTLTARVLDQAGADRPVLVYDSSFHQACANTRALEMAGVADLPDPLNGHIVRDTLGRPTGMLHEAAIPLVVARLPDLTDDDWLQGLLAGQALAARHGITGVLDPALREREARIYARAEGQGALTLRVAAAALVTPEDTPDTALHRLTALRARHPGPDLHVHSAKIFMDGVFENRTAACLAPYADAQGGNAPCMFGGPETNGLFTALDAARFAIHVHVIGDAAAARALDGLAAARSANGPWPAQHQLAHLQLVEPSDLPRLARLATANIQPLWARLEPPFSDPSLAMIGPARWPLTYAFRRILDQGADWCLSSDWPVSTLNPFEIIETAVTRQKRRDDAPEPPFFPDQALTVLECLAGYTTRAARACWREGFTGMLRPGFSADLAVIDQDILTCAPDAISRTRVLLTLFKGREVWRDPGF